MEMFRANCGKCGHLFDIIALPTPIDEFAKASADRPCPLCGNIKGHKCGPSRPLSDEEAAAKSAAMSQGRTRGVSAGGQQT